MIAFLLAGAVIGYFAAGPERDAHARFMRQCAQDHKEYECTALWHAAAAAARTDRAIGATTA